MPITSGDAGGTRCQPAPNVNRLNDAGSGTVASKSLSTMFPVYGLLP